MLKIATPSSVVLGLPLLVFIAPPWVSSAIPTNVFQQYSGNAFIGWLILNAILTVNVFTKPAGVNKFAVFARNTAISMTAVMGWCALAYGWESVIAFYVPLYIWGMFGLLGYAIRGLCLAVKNSNNLRLFAGFAVRSMVALGLLAAATGFGWLNSGVSGYQTGCLNPFLPLTDPATQDGRSM